MHRWRGSTSHACKHCKEAALKKEGKQEIQQSGDVIHLVEQDIMLELFKFWLGGIG
jgi:hypothetical protein